MLEIAAKLPPGALVGGEDRALAHAVTRTGGARFVAREADLVWSDGRITGWRETRRAVAAVASAPNTGNTWYEAGPPGALICQEGVNCGFTLPTFAQAVERFTVAVIYRSAGEARTLPMAQAGQAKLVLLAYDGRSLRLELGGQEAEVVASVPGMDHPADFFIGCRSNRAGLAKTLGQSRLHEVMFWPDRCLPRSAAAEDHEALAGLERHFRWTY